MASQKRVTGSRTNYDRNDRPNRPRSSVQDGDWTVVDGYMINQTENNSTDAKANQKIKEECSSIKKTTCFGSKHNFGTTRPFNDEKDAIDRILENSDFMTGVSYAEIEGLWRRSLPAAARAETSKPARWDRRRLMTFSTGKPSEAFGQPYRAFDNERFIARLPAPPFLFMDRVTRIDPRPWILKPDGWITAEFDLSPDAWYYQANRMPVLPYVALLEIPLQPCGWLASYMGSALAS